MKKQVCTEFFEDMMRYIPGLKPEDYVVTAYENNPSVIKHVREYFDKHLPVDLTTWVRFNVPAENLIYKFHFTQQISFVRREIANIFSDDYEEIKNELLSVISSHYSKSVKLPVYRLNVKKLNLELVFFNNFYGWTVSVKSDKALNWDFMNLFDKEKVLEYPYCYQLPKDKLYGSFEQSNKKFTVEIKDDYDFYTFVFLLKNYLQLQ